MRTRIASGGAGLLATAVWLAAADARAQPPPGVAQAPAKPTTDDTAPLPVPSDLVVAQAGGLTAVQAGTRAAATSWNAKASMETVRGAAARVDEAWASFLPRL